MLNVVTKLRNRYTSALNGFIRLIYSDVEKQLAAICPWRTILLLQNKIQINKSL